METITKDNITITLDLNSDWTVNLRQKMTIEYIKEDGSKHTFEAYPDVDVVKDKPQKYGLIKNQFDLAKATMRFNDIYDKIA